ncbi:gastrula zinc finger protein XlCGF57.1 [Helicoverpa armigera]|uniref:gastrula zinc finger protein XlCGF57.1 n=1 Tax=Helicoverpa armigera TaxID=29058 RepID=UPI003082E4CA
MPPKRKLGRPPGSKTKRKKTSPKHQKNASVVIKKKEKESSSETDIEYICNICNKKFLTGQELLKHHKNCKAVVPILSDGGVRKAEFSCNECRKKFRFQKSFKKHCLLEHSKLPNSVACDQCDVKCPTKRVLIEHIKKVHDRDIYECPHCKRQFVRRSHVFRHMAQSGCDGHGGASFMCEICESKFSRKDNLMAHIRMQHIIPNAFTCKQCLYSTKNFSKLVNHWHKHHSETPDQYQCHHCSKWTSSRAAMTKHLEIHGEKKYACDVCGYSTYTIEVMRRHVLTHVEDKPYKCTLCGNSYIQRVQLARHLEKHSGNMCLKCGNTFTTRAQLLIHLREHMGLEKLFCPVESCPLVSKEFINEASWQNHLKIHMDDKPHSCDVCGKQFHSVVNLRRHLETHTLDRPRRCMYCVSARAYVRGLQLIRHVRKHHPAVFRGHLAHVRQVLGSNSNILDRVKKSEIESILNLLDVESDRILQGYSGAGVLYGGMQDEDESSSSNNKEEKMKGNSPLMSEEELTENLRKLLAQLIDNETLNLFGWPEESVDVVLEKVIEQCGAKAADRDKWTRVQRLRENSKHLFLYVLEDKNIARMLDTHTIDQIIKHILKQVSDEDTKDVK